MKAAEEALKKYRDITIEIMDDVKRGDYEKVQPLFSSRAALLRKLKDSGFDSEGFKTALKREGILEIDGELREAIEGRKRDLALKINSSVNANRAAVYYRRGERNAALDILNEKL